MKKPTLLMILLLCLSFSAAADDFQGAELPENQNISYSYSSFGMGYGFSYIKNGKTSEALHSVDFAVDYGFVAMSTTSKIGIGFGGKTDILYSPDASDSLSVHTMFGPEFVVPVSRYLNIDILVGPVFSYMTYGSNSPQESISAIGPAADISAELLFPAFTGLSLKAGVTAYGSFGFHQEAWGVSVIPYASISMKFGPESILPIYYSPIYYYPIYYPYYVL